MGQEEDGQGVLFAYALTSLGEEYLQRRGVFEMDPSARELRKHGFTDIIDRHFSLGSHLNARDVKAVRKTVSGLVKLLYPHGELSGQELAELVEIALEGRRRVKEQLKKMGSFEYHQTSFSYIDNDSREERRKGEEEATKEHGHRGRSQPEVAIV